MKRFTVAVILMIALATAANATRLVPVERTCPIGGEKYKSFDIMSTSQFGMRLDFRPNGPIARLPWEECPNGFVVWKEDFTKEEIAKLTPVVGSAKYQQMRDTHVIAYRVVFLRRTLGETDVELAWLILKAAWEAEDQKREQLRQTYLAEAQTALAARAATMPTHDEEEWWPCAIVVAEIDRQRSRFRESIAKLDALPVRELQTGSALLAVIAQIRDRARKGDPNPADFKAPGEPED